jgi:hypothetical protein
MRSYHQLQITNARLTREWADENDWCQWVQPDALDHLSIHAPIDHQSNKTVQAVYHRIRSGSQARLVFD